MDDRFTLPQCNVLLLLLKHQKYAASQCPGELFRCAFAQHASSGQRHQCHMHHYLLYILYSGPHVDLHRVGVSKPSEQYEQHGVAKASSAWQGPVYLLVPGYI